jgi:hypothetical protein
MRSWSSFALDLGVGQPLQVFGALLHERGGRAVLDLEELVEVGARRLLDELAVAALGDESHLEEAASRVVASSS